ANQEVQKTQTQLAEKEKLAALGELAASLAHEINNPLGIINNYLTLLENENRQTPEALEHIKVSKQELKRVSKTIKQLLNLYLPQKKEEFRQTDLAGLLNHTLDLFETELQENRITLQREIPASAPAILAREEELRQVFLNLLMNSKDFTPPGGTISVHLRQSNGRLQIEFVDSGVGIPEENFSQLFRPFFTTKPTGKGTGLGLSISQRIVQDHKGAIRAKNVSGGGASFTIQLPLR
ncbi:MAG: ATP-binding protein, partial [candidate division Zixibacteria bacterium]|nr:ATP-binding protein [candidate division Zixibacteria bacterium]